MTINQPFCAGLGSREPSVDARAFPAASLLHYVEHTSNKTACCVHHVFCMLNFFVADDVCACVRSLRPADLLKAFLPAHRNFSSQGIESSGCVGAGFLSTAVARRGKRLSRCIHIDSVLRVDLARGAAWCCGTGEPGFWLGS